MTLTFASSADTAAEFRNLVLGFGLLDVVIVAAFTYHSRGLALAVTFRTRCIIGFVAFLGLLWFAYASSYQKFITADVTAAEVRLEFVGPFARQVVLPHRDIAAVRFGMPGRGKKCRITFEDRSSTVYRGAWIADEANVCKGLRDDIVHAMGSAVTVEN